MEIEKYFYSPIDGLNYYDYNFPRLDPSSSDIFNQKELFPKQQDSKDDYTETDERVSMTIKRNPIHGIYVEC